MNKIKLLAYRTKIRMKINKLPKEMIEITMNECKRALERKK